jgi:phosphate transport system substrate-binding protein
VVVDNHGTGGGFKRYLEGEVDIVDASRAAKADEESTAKERGIDWTRFVVGYDGITLVVNPKNDFVKSLTVEQLKSIWAPGSKVKSWKDIDPAWPARNIIFYSPDNDSGTFEFFTEAIVGKAKSQRDDVQSSSDDNTLVNGVAGDSDGIGYFGYAYFAANNDKLRALAVQNGPSGQPVLPSPSTIADKSYAPLSRPLYIYVKNSAARRPEVGKFVRFYIEKVDELSVKGGYDPPTAQDKTARLSRSCSPAAIVKARHSPPAAG